MSYQPEERYWTDYLRIALPVAGLLLMLAVFWVWASNFIDGDSTGDEPVATATPEVVVEVVNPPTSTATATVPVVITPNQTPEPAGTEAADAQSGNGAVPTAADDGPNTGGDEPTPEDDGSDEAQFAIDSTVVVVDGPVRMRSGPSTSAEIIIESVETGTELTITGPPEADEEGQDWYPVVDLEGTEGYIRNDFLQSAE